VSKKLGSEEYMETFGDLVEEIVARVFLIKIFIPINRERYKETFGIALMDWLENNSSIN
jgi:hypothetical protein